jgi:hypothetical protein
MLKVTYATSDTPDMSKSMMRALFAGRCQRCRRSYRKDDPVFPMNGEWICVPCQRVVDAAPDRR